jgi:cytochrome oxidase assembly protein ShyY1
VLATLRQGRYVALLAVGVLLAAGCVLAGLWQAQRYGEKRLANSELRQNETAAPVPVDRELAVRRAVGTEQRWRLVTATGRYDAANQLLVRQRAVNGRAGFLVLTPLRTDAGPDLLVVRGFVLATGAATQSPVVPDPPSGEVTITGRVQPSEPGRERAGLPDRQIDVPALATRLGAPTYGGYVELVSATPPPTGLVLVPPPDLSNPAGGAYEGQHLAYVVQWFFFALLALALPFVLAFLDRRAATGETPREPTTPAAATRGPRLRPRSPRRSSSATRSGRGPPSARSSRRSGPRPTCRSGTCRGSPCRRCR